MNMPESIIAYLGVGSNMGDPSWQLETAVASVGCLPATVLLRRSPVYASKPWGKLDQPDFLNMVVEIETNLSPDALLTCCKEIEMDQGRVEDERWGPRPIDIDILMYGDATITTDSLVVPHPHIWERAFVLRPLSDLRPDIVSPDGIGIGEVLSRPEIASQGVWSYEPARKPVNHEA